jgi:hypothetical protein
MPKPPPLFSESSQILNKTEINQSKVLHQSIVRVNFIHAVDSQRLKHDGADSSTKKPDSRREGKTN